MPERALALEVRTPTELALRADAFSARVPTETGQVGLRPGAEPAVLAVEAGVVLVRSTGGTRYLGTAGGLLRLDGEKAVLLTPLAIAGDGPEEILAELDRRLGEPGSEMEARARLGKLESKILEELRRETGEKGPERSSRP